MEQTEQLRGGDASIWKKEGIDISIADAAPEGHFRIKRKVYQNILEECYNGDVTYIRLYHPETDDVKGRIAESKV